MSNEKIAHEYIQLVIDSYEREVQRGDITHMSLLADKLLLMPEAIQPYLHRLTKSITICYKENTDALFRENLFSTLNHLKEIATDDSTAVQQALAECSEININSIETDENMEPGDNEIVEQSVETLISYAENTEDPEIKHKIEEKLHDTLLKKAIEEEKNDPNAALDLYKQAYERSKSIIALSRIAHILSDLSDQYQSAVECYTLLSQNPEAQHDYMILHDALKSLQKMYDDLPESHPIRNNINHIAIEIINLIFENHASVIKSYDVFHELEQFAEMTQNDPSIERVLAEQRAKFTPPKPPRSKLEDVEKQIESTKNSSRRHIETLVTLLNSEKNNEETFPLVQQAINKWLEGAVRVDVNQVFIKDLEGVTLLARNGDTAAIYYLVTHLAQEKSIQQALSLSARFLMSPHLSLDTELTETLKEYTRHFIEDYAKQSISSRLEKFIFHKENKLVNYAKDLLEIINTTPPCADLHEADITIEGLLQVKNHGSDSSFNHYIDDIGKLGVKSEAIKPLSAAERRHAASKSHKERE